MILLYSSGRKDCKSDSRSGIKGVFISYPPSHSLNSIVATRNAIAIVLRNYTIVRTSAKGNISELEGQIYELYIRNDNRYRN